MPSDQQAHPIPSTNVTADRRRRRHLFGICFIASIGGFLFGYDLSLIGSANTFLKDQFHLDDAGLGFVTASAALGCMVGPFLGAWMCDRVGRNRSMMIAACLLAAGAIVTACTRTIFLFNVFRIVGGVGVGLCSIASPMYIAETTPAKMRGRYGIMYQMSIVVGSTISPLIAYGLVRIFPDDVSWRWMFASQMVFVLLFAGFLFLLPPSPRWLAELERFEEANDVLERIHGPEAACHEFGEIKASLAREKGGFSELFGPDFRRALLIGLLLAFFNNWTGWSVIGGYVPILLQMAGVPSHQTAILQFSLTYLAMAVMTVASMFLIDRVGRRPLWIFASFMMSVITALMGLIFYAHATGVVVLMIIALCTVPHGIALGGMPWLMMSEIFPTRIRAKAVAVTTTFLWIAIFSGVQLFPVITGWSERKQGSIALAFWLFTVICLLSAIFGFKMLPETRGRTLEEIATSWSKRRQERDCKPGSAPLGGEAPERQI